MLPINNIQQKDCLDFLRSLPDACVDLVLTDPPYNVSGDADLVFNGKIIKKNFGDWDRNFDPLPVLKELKRVLKPKGQIYIFCGTKQIPLYIQTLEKEWIFRNLLVWYKTNPAPRMSKTNFVFATEYIVYGINPPSRPSDIVFNYQAHKDMYNVFVTASLQNKERLRSSTGMAIHPTQKPLSILTKLISISSKPDDVVLDCFMGVGSTAIACILTGRQFIGCEKDERYHAISLERISKIREEIQKRDG